jgi:SAM-dependent methyltransferase
MRGTLTGVVTATTASALQAPDLSARARAILERLGDDSDTIPEDRRARWKGYLAKHTPRYLNLLSLLSECPQARSLLDVGNFPGHFTVLARQLGLDAAGLDIDPDRAGELWAHHGVVERQADVEVDAFPFEQATFDVVVLAEVLEHLRVNPMHALRECHRVLRRGGHLIVSVPNVSLRHRLKFLVGRDYQGDIVAAFQQLARSGHMGHFRLYTHREIIQMLEHTGFRPKLTRTAGGLPTGRWRLVRYLGPARDHFRSHFYVLAERN